ncbi:hypothetical protein HRR83_001819 [Exophiala dermatitidis]|uniref:N-acetyltransferase domain-containing protein n=1 Tax=Exophiala dermatitidis TaxID=5970 RepID=A0AAN6F1J6_EXODE|nr:hypothetical protein HRR73_004950 [Exophiala dermatitidis]KAJ4523277.1 hypothetical protein HRR75_001678 [Exophiala dermatitidis]KAJ4526622.1 hypothetical protein HRR74_001822 [Exophiala dermatitidis]KAJ4532130.1 hypothetical protein HRR76_007129 [Exophiala dermatitidis]KAJ4546165.1 hypothetical protein HRR77_004702 [Exophiala dermatitidis]
MTLNKRPGSELNRPSAAKVPRFGDKSSQHDDDSRHPHESGRDTATEIDTQVLDEHATGEELTVTVKFTEAKSVTHFLKPGTSESSHARPFNCLIGTGLLTDTSCSFNYVDDECDHHMCERAAAPQYVEVVVACQDQPDKIIGVCCATLIKKDSHKRCFYSTTAVPLTELTLLAFDLFDRYGRFKQQYRCHPVKRGSGFWQDQLNHGAILLIENIHVREPYRRRGIGLKMVTRLLHAMGRETVTGEFTAVVRPNAAKYFHFQEAVSAILQNQKRAKMLANEDVESIRWFRRLGFRRIGSSIWFGLYCGNQPPQFYIELDHDHDLTKELAGAKINLPEAVAGALARANNKSFLKVMRRQFHNIPFEDDRWMATDEEGNTLLHIAALRFCSDALNWLMEKGPGPAMAEMRNTVGDTPLEALLLELETRRIGKSPGRFVDVDMDSFEGHSRQAVKCIARLRDLELETTLDFKRLAFGCTCGECIMGFLSPRMRYALAVDALAIFETSEEYLDCCSGEEWVWHLMDWLPLLNAHVMRQLSRYKSMRRGFIKLVECIFECLEACLPPDERAIDIVIDGRGDSAIIDKFLMGNGDTEEVVVNIFRGVMMSSVAVTGESADLDYQKGREDYYSLPECRNDHEYQFVIQQCDYFAHDLS